MVSPTPVLAQDGIQPAIQKDQEPHGLGAHRDDMVARLVIHLGM